MRQIVELSPVECRSRLDTTHVGRLAFLAPDGLRMVPMNYAMNGDVIVFVTAPDSHLATHGEGAEAVFEIDEIDAEGEQAWSVVVSGRLERPPAADEDWDIAGWRNPTPWVAGDRWFHLQLRSSAITGRRLE